MLTKMIPLIAVCIAGFLSIAHGAKKNDAASQPNIVEIAASNADFSTLVAAVKAAGLVDVLSGESEFTVFAPTNAAFDALPAKTLESLLKPENKDMLVSILTYHVVPGTVPASAVKTMPVKTVNGQAAQLKVSRGTVTIDNANVVKTDIMAANGVIHVIDSVILPEVAIN
ncbi:MAG: fasciclin domain-containing protein [Opitutales bacterium]|nr:fasciclin domain-containing protein [Opitutales bacterium]